jgi:hypothetical protein
VQNAFAESFIGRFRDECLHESLFGLLDAARRLIAAIGRVCIHRAGQRLGITEVDDGIWLATFMHYDLGYINLEQRTLQTIELDPENGTG